MLIIKWLAFFCAFFLESYFVLLRESLYLICTSKAFRANLKIRWKYYVPYFLLNLLIST